VKAPTTERDAVAQLAEELRGAHHFVVAAALEAGYRELAGAAVAELVAISPRDTVGAAMLRAWGEGRDAAVLAGYRSLAAPETDGDVDAALAVIDAPPPADVLAPLDDLTALAQYELAHQCRVVGLPDAARLADCARTADEWRAVEQALLAGTVAAADGIRRDGARLAAHNLARGDRHMAVATMAALAHVSPATWLSSTRTMIATEAAQAEASS
jgi:hypothetical protein